jgi:hypothetical protein
LTDLNSSFQNHLQKPTTALRLFFLLLCLRLTVQVVSPGEYISRLLATNKSLPLTPKNEPEGVSLPYTSVMGTWLFFYPKLANSAFFRVIPDVCKLELDLVKDQPSPHLNNLLSLNNNFSRAVFSYRT